MKCFCFVLSFRNAFECSLCESKRYRSRLARVYATSKIRMEIGINTNNINVHVFVVYIFNFMYTYIRHHQLWIQFNDCLHAFVRTVRSSYRTLLCVVLLALCSVFASLEYSHLVFIDIHQLRVSARTWPKQRHRIVCACTVETKQPSITKTNTHSTILIRE